MIAEYLEDMETETKALRALIVHGAYHSEMAQRAQISLLAKAYRNDAEKSRYELLFKRHLKEARRVTPLLKYYGSERAVYMARMCMQIHGGVGYTKEYKAEQLLRDALVLPIYEGTSQIQALMAMKDKLMAIIRNPQDFLAQMAQARWRSLSARDPLERRLAKLQTLSYSAQQHLITRTATDKFRGLQDKPLTDWPKAFLQNWNPKRDFSYAMLHAERFTKLLTDVTIAELLYKQARKHPERYDVLERHLERAEPRCRYWLDEITTTGQRLLEKLQQLQEKEEKSAG